MTTPKSVYLFLCPGMADWEPAYAISLLSDQYTDIPKNNSYPVRTFGVTQEPVRSVGGLTLVPDFSVDNVSIDDTAMVILPGSTYYEKEDPDQLASLISRCTQAQIPVAAICGGTLFLARHGFLDTIRHTSAGKEWLKAHAPQYQGEQFYTPSPSVSDKGIITANPLGFLEFAAHIFLELDVFPSAFIDQLVSMTKGGYFDADALNGAE